jgi:5-methylcytosine-specific restriction endonuclease McrA
MIMSSKAQFFEYWKERLIEKGFFIDWSKPSCWACGEFWNGKYDVKSSHLSDVTILKAWEKAPLQRCYIVPVSLGGTDDESNLFLLCKDCQDLAPKTASPEIFFQWARVEKHIKCFNQRNQQYLEEFGISEELFVEFLELYKTEKFKKIPEKSTGFYWSHNSHSGLSKKMTPSSFLDLILYYYNEDSKT